jgi:hypothetical protein
VNRTPELQSGYHSNSGRREPRHLGIFLSFVVICVWSRSVVSVVAFTDASKGKVGVLFLLTLSLLYFGFVTALGKWGTIQKGASKSWLYWVRGVPATLSLGIIALVVMILRGGSWIGQQAYAIQVLVVVCALSSIANFVAKVSQSFSATRRGQIREVGFGNAGNALNGNNEWKDLNPWAQSSFVVSHVLDAAIWTLLVIYYRFYSHPLLFESSWVMISLWLFLLSSWLHSAGTLLIAYRGFKSGRNGTDAGCPSSRF